VYRKVAYWVVFCFVRGCVIYTKFINNDDIESLQKNLDRLEEWAAENEMKINPNICKVVSFTMAWFKHPLNYILGDQLIPEASSCKYLGIILRSDLNWADLVD